MNITKLVLIFRRTYFLYIGMQEIHNEIVGLYEFDKSSNTFERCVNVYHFRTLTNNIKCCGQIPVYKRIQRTNVLPTIYHFALTYIPYILSGRRNLSFCLKIY